jgi:hypothetical protein
VAVFEELDLLTFARNREFDHDRVPDMIQTLTDLCPDEPVQER